MLPTNSAKGFTLIELMVVVIIIAILAAMAAPSMSRQIQQMRINEGVASIEAAFKEARAQALVSQQPTVAQYIDDAKGKRVVLKSLGSDFSTTTEFANYPINNKLTINISPTNLATLNFMPDKKIFLGTLSLDEEKKNITNTALSGGTFSVCTGNGTDQYRLSIDNVGNIATAKGGVCS